MRKLMVLALGLVFTLGTVTAFAQDTPPKKSGKKKGCKKGGKKTPKKGTGAALRLSAEIAPPCGGLLLAAPSAAADGSAPLE
jgi:hypothetical protein